MLVDILAICQAETRKSVRWLSPILKASLRKGHIACVFGTRSICRGDTLAWATSKGDPAGPACSSLAACWHSYWWW